MLDFQAQGQLLARRETLPGGPSFGMTEIKTKVEKLKRKLERN